MIPFLLACVPAPQLDGDVVVDGFLEDSPSSALSAGCTGDGLDISWVTESHLLVDHYEVHRVRPRLLAVHRVGAAPHLRLARGSDWPELPLKRDTP